MKALSLDCTIHRDSKGWWADAKIQLKNDKPLVYRFMDDRMGIAPDNVNGHVEFFSGIILQKLKEMNLSPILNITPTDLEAAKDAIRNQLRQIESQLDDLSVDFMPP